MKKLFVALMVIVMLVAFSVTAFAARSLSADEVRLVDALRGKEILGEKVEQADITAFENYLMGLDEPLSAAAVDSIIGSIDEVIAIIEATGAKTVDGLSKAVKDQVLNIAKSALALAGLSISITSDAKTSKIVITDNAGNPVIDRVVIKNTGFANFSQIVLISSIVIAAAAATFVLARSRRNKTVFAKNV